MIFNSLNANDLARIATYIHQADGLIISAGAGMGVDSGLPDFRGDEGFWNAYPALAKAGINFTAIANTRSFEKNPRLAWGFYGHRLNLYRKTKPHKGFTLLKSLGEKITYGCFVFTSNVDGQFQKSGFTSTRIVECHGSIHHLQCLNSCNDDIWSANNFHPIIDDASCMLISEIPKCPYCNGYARPNILQFNDWSWLENRTQHQNQMLNTWLENVKNPVIIEIGAGKSIPIIRNFSKRIAHEKAGHLIRINPREPDGIRPHSDVSLNLGGLDGLCAINDALSTFKVVK
jgi:NAD-dependent SIR2 family protein deacetylase